MHGFAVHCSSWNWKHRFQLGVECSAAPHVVPLLFSHWSCRTLTCKASGEQKDWWYRARDSLLLSKWWGWPEACPNACCWSSSLTPPLQKLVPVPDMPGLWWIVEIHGGAAAPAPGLVSPPWRSSLAAAVPPCVSALGEVDPWRLPKEKELFAHDLHSWQAPCCPSRAVCVLFASAAGALLGGINSLLSEPERCWQNKWFDSSVILSCSCYAGDQRFSVA